MKNKLTLTINSFSYKRALPEDKTENGGGFIFDCRAIHNPGRFEEYKSLTGKDQKVIDFLDQEEEMKSFLKHVFALVDQSVKKYIQRDFTNLMVSFGCTGGQHRSVYCAENLANHLRTNFDIQIVVHHIEQELLKSKKS
ncbi:MAG TPA: ATP-binding protein [Bacteroidales bacterium]|jgi:RNase adaptor protein for sRNA GlmZ degradation|nr:ATP-binding protein [Bacteroidales bacterium]